MRPGDLSASLLKQNWSLVNLKKVKEDLAFQKATKIALEDGLQNFSEQQFVKNYRRQKVMGLIEKPNFFAPQHRKSQARKSSFVHVQQRSATEVQRANSESTDGNRMLIGGLDGNDMEDLLNDIQGA